MGAITVADLQLETRIESGWGNANVKEDRFEETGQN